MIAGVEIENGSCDPDHAPFKESFVIRKLGLDIEFYRLYVRKIWRL